MWVNIFIANGFLLFTILFVLGIGHLTYADYYMKMDKSITEQVFIAIPIFVVAFSLLFLLFWGIGHDIPPKDPTVKPMSYYQIYGGFIFVPSCIFYVVVGSQVLVKLYNKTRRYFGKKRNRI